VAFYGFAGNPGATDDALEELFGAIAAFGGPFVVVGDFNMMQNEGAVGRHLAAGTVRGLDEDFDGTRLPNTGPTRSRRIDYALTQRGLHAVDIRHSEELGDHLSVAYTLADVAQVTGKRGPKRRWDRVEDVDAIAARFEQAWSPDVFEDLLQRRRLDDAWTLLSDVAEAALFTDKASGCVPRSEEWHPQDAEGARSRQPKGRESDTLCRLRALQRRLGMLASRPGDGALRARVARSLAEIRRRIPELPRRSWQDLVQLSPFVDQFVTGLASQEEDARRERWRRALDENEGCQRKWVRSRAENALETETQPVAEATAAASAIHPANMLREEGLAWQSRWSRAPAPEAGRAALLAELPERAPSDIAFSMDGSDLRKAAAAMAGKAAGPDAWSSDDLVRLPQRWWNEAARLWTTAVSEGRLPGQWCRAIVVLVRKPNGKTRPISLCAVMWRAGARVMVRLLRQWVSSWLLPGDLGGAPGRSIFMAHLRIHRAVCAGFREFTQQDLSAFFDTLEVKAVVDVLARLGAPSWLATTLTAFYSNAARLFTAEGLVSDGWFRPTRGVAQGCPLSPLVALAVMHTWVLTTATQHIRVLAFVDDRLLWPGGPNTTGARLEEALRRSDRFDQAFDLKCDPTKSVYSAGGGQSSFADVARRRGYNTSDSLDVLGIALQLDAGGQRRPLRLKLRRAVLRLRFMRWGTRDLDRKKKLLQALVLPMLTWCGGFAEASETDLNTIKDELYRLFSSSFTAEAPKVLIYQTLGWKFEPRVALDCAALRAGCRVHVKASLGETTDDPGAGPWHEAVPLIRDLLARHGWTVSADGSCILRWDRAGNPRSYHIGFDNFGVLEDWLHREARGRYMRVCGRVNQRYHREDPQLARGPDLPKPDPVNEYAFAGHAAALATSQSRETRKAAAATGGTAWFYNAGKLNARWQCLCGKSFPSRPHVTWACPDTADLRRGLRAPVDRAEERLFATHIAEIPPAPPPLDVDEFMDDLVAAVRNAFQKTSRVYFATDGAAKHKVATYAVVVADPAYTCAIGVGDEDQSPYKAELMALDSLARALNTAAQQGCVGQAVVAVDCSAAIAAVRKGGGALPLLAASAREACNGAAALGLQMTIVWTPAHGRRLGWSPEDDDKDAGFYRDLNDRADCAAGACLQRRRSGSLRERWHQEAAAALQWECSAVRVAAAAAARLSDHLRAVPLPAAAGAVPPPGAEDGAEDLA
jgi:hypothetical protein